MDKKYLRKEILNLVEAIAEQTEIICAYENDIPIIELDIVKENIRNLYDAYNRLAKGNAATQAAPADEKPLPEATAPAFNVQVPELPVLKEQTPTPTPTVQAPQAIQPAETVSEEPLKQEETPLIQPVQTPPPAVPEVKKTDDVQPVTTQQQAPKNKPKPADLFSDSPTMADKFKSDTPSLNDKMAMQKNDASLAGKMNKTKISDIKMAIGINEKFRFVNELFEGNLADYTDALNRLNTCSSPQEAAELFDALALQLKWDTRGENCATLRDIVNRRYL